VAPYALRRTARSPLGAVQKPRADIRLPSSDRGPLNYLLRRLAIAVGLIVFVALIAYADRGGYRDVDERGIGLLDALYYSTVSVTTTGYGDITPVSDRARLISTLFVTPARVLFLIILVGTTLEILAERTRAAYRERFWRRTLRDHTIICGFGVKGVAAADTLVAHGVAPGDVVVIDPRPGAAEDARRRGFAGVVGDASTSGALDAAGVREAAAVVIAPDRDDTAVLITLTARELNRDATIVAAVRDSDNAHLAQQGGADSVIVSSGAAGRLLGQAVRSPRIVTILEDLLNVGEGLDIVERDVAPEHAGPLADYHSAAPVIAVVRGGEVMRFDDPRAAELQAGDRVVCLSSNA
jgi:voltage-gated potassium channel Kch